MGIDHICSSRHGEQSSNTNRINSVKWHDHRAGLAYETRKASLTIGAAHRLRERTRRDHNGVTSERAAVEEALALLARRDPQLDAMANFVEWAHTEWGNPTDEEHSIAKTLLESSS